MHVFSADGPWATGRGLLRADFCRPALFFCVEGVQGCHCFSWELSLACRAPGARATFLHLRVGLGQNGQILFISVEQLSLNVADDSAKTLSVLGNMGDFLDDCLLRFLQMCRRPPQKYPRFWGPTDFFKILPKKDPYRNHTKSMN